ncbi:Ima1 N-terminal domain-containing protein [Mycena haematopus]|nr:Ima1 N-terminal domain-containing protein [Mycena haematopus]
MLRRRSNISCYFCNSAVSLPKDPTNFRCPHCNCLNRWVDGQIVSDEPAMHDESLNSQAFSSQPKDRIPTMYAPGVFCHTCQTNQMLLVNLLANYLDNDESDQRMQTLDEYRESLHLRYPPVCDSCRPAVEEEIRRKDAMARTQALGGWLNQTKGKARQRQASLTKEETAKLGMEMLAWRIRGYLWATTVLVSIIGSASAALGYQPFPWLAFMLPGLPIIAVVSILWAAWDPTYSSFRSARIQGRDVRVRGKTKHITLQMVSWASRLTTSIILAAYWTHKTDLLRLSQFPSSRSRVYFSVSLVLELCATFSSLFILQLQQPPAIRLIDTAKHKSVPLAHAPKPPLLVRLPLHRSLKIFSRGCLSRQSRLPFRKPLLYSECRPCFVPHAQAEQQHLRSMNGRRLAPTDAKRKTKESGDSLWLRPQRFFAPEAPTGLEGLFERTKIIDDITMNDATSAPHSGSRPASWNWWWVVAPSLAFLAGVASWVWSRRSAPYFPPPATTLQFGPLDTVFFGPL